MNIGMLWFDNDRQKDLQTKVARAAEYYRQKYGIQPTVCFVHPSMMDVKKLSTGTVEVRVNGTVMPNHFWIGVNGKNGTTGK